jgi:hypothetical protein
MSFNWIILGAVVGQIGSLRSDALVQCIACVLSGMIVFAIPGLCLGLIGGDVKGSYIGAAGGFLGCWFCELTRGVSIPSPSLQIMVVFGALAGATCVLYLRTAVWTYGIFARRAFRLIGRIPGLGSAFRPFGLASVREPISEVRHRPSPLFHASARRHDVRA